MILEDLLVYLQSRTAITSLIGMNIYRIQAKKDAPMPFMVVEITSGPREKITSTLMEQIAYARITVNCGPQDVNKSSQAIEAALRSLENYRGAMGNSQDIHISCGAIRSWAGIGDVSRFQFDAIIRSTETYAEPV